MLCVTGQICRTNQVQESEEVINQCGLQLDVSCRAEAASAPLAFYMNLRSAMRYEHLLFSASQLAGGLTGISTKVSD
jgi:hypothetical protein